MTVPYRAVLKGRYGVGFELNPQYFFRRRSLLRGSKTKSKYANAF